MFKILNSPSVIPPLRHPLFSVILNGAERSEGSRRIRIQKEFEVAEILHFVQNDGRGEKNDGGRKVIYCFLRLSTLDMLFFLF